MGILTKVKSAAKKYISNVVGGAKIVGSAVKNVANNIGTAVSQKAQSIVTNAGGLSAIASKAIPGYSNVTNQSYYSSGGRDPQAYQPQTTSSTKKTISGGTSGSTAYSSNTVLTPGQFNTTPRTLTGGSKTSSVDSSFFTPTNTSTLTMGTFNASAGGTGGLGGNASSVALPSTPTQRDVGGLNLQGLATTDTKINPATGLFDTQGDLNQVEGGDDELSKALKELREENKIPERENIFENEYIQEQQREVNRQKQEVNNWQGQLNNIVAKQQQDLMRHEQAISAAGGTVDGFSGRAAAINREAAYAALPIQAQLSVAQGNLELAQDYLKDLTTMVKEDIDNRYEYKKAQYNAVKEIADKREKRQLELMDKDNDREYEEKQKNVEMAWDLADKARESGQTYVLGKIMNLISQPDAKNFAEQLSNFASQVTDSGSGIGGSISSTTQAIINNPSLFNDLTPTERGKVINQLQANGFDTTNLGVKGLSDTAIKEVSQTQKALSDLEDLRVIISSNEDKIGPIKGLARLNPWSESRKVQADVDRVRQTVGKALEGGVLRKEDEEKYKKILSTLVDTPETALYKIDALYSTIQRDIENYKSLQQSAGRSLNVGASLQKEGSQTSQEDLRTKYNY